VPFVVGLDGVGLLEDGRRVFFGGPRPPFGTFAQKAVAHQARCWPIPDEVDDVTAAALPNPALSSWLPMVHQAKVEPGQTVLVLGATGTAGKLAIQIAKLLGAGRVVAAGRNEEILVTLPELGADATIQLDQPHEELVKAFSEEPGFHTVLDFVWGKPTEALLAALTRPDFDADSFATKVVQIGEGAGPTITLPAAVPTVPGHVRQSHGIRRERHPEAGHRRHPAIRSHDSLGPRRQERQASSNPPLEKTKTARTDPGGRRSNVGQTETHPRWVKRNSHREVCGGHPHKIIRRSRRWVQTLVARYLAEGEAAFEPRSRRPHGNPRRTCEQVEDAIVALRKQLIEAGHDAGAETIAWHLRQQSDRQVGAVPSVATIWRVLSRRGFVTPQPHKRPRSSWRRFTAELPNECWQADITHWQLADDPTRRPTHRPRWRSSTSSTTTRGCWSPAPPAPCSKPVTSSPACTPRWLATAARNDRSPTTAQCSPATPRPRLGRARA
jgi:homeodomain-containing protein/zinc-binding dehydrogenase